jgi:hypothetical protein
MKFVSVGAAMKERGHEEMRSTVEKEDFDVDKRLPVSLYLIHVQSCSVRGQVSACCGLVDVGTR